MNTGEVFKLAFLLVGLVIIFLIYRSYKNDKDLPKSGLARAFRFSALIWLVIALLKMCASIGFGSGYFDLAFTTQGVTTFHICCQSESTP